MLKIQGITKQFPTLFESTLKGIDLELQKGEFCVLIGSNGSGKSTLLKTISGELKATNGKIIFENKNITHFPLHKRAHFISSVTQDLTKGTISEMTLLENLSLSAIRGEKADFSSFHQLHSFFQETLKSTKLGLEHYLENKLSSLSGGQRQMVAMVMATLKPPKLLLLDEHSSALDPKSSLKLMQLTDQLIEKHQITTLMVTHNLNDAIQYGNRLIMLHKGKIVLDLKDAEKKSLKTQDLLTLFHHYEDELLIQPEES